MPLNKKSISSLTISMKSKSVDKEKVMKKRSFSLPDLNRNDGKDKNKTNVKNKLNCS